MTESHKWYWLTISLIAMTLIYLLSPILSPFLTAALLAYMGNPLVNYLQGCKMPRTIAVFIVFLLIAAVVLFLILLLIPMLETQIALFISKIPAIIHWLQTDILPKITERLGIPNFLSAENIRGVVTRHWQQAGDILTALLSTISQSSIAIIAWFSNLILIPVVTFYLLRDWHRVWDNVRQLLPRNLEPIIVRLTQQCNEVLGAFFRGQLLVMFSLAAIYSTGLWFVGLDLALLIGLIAGLVSIVPYLGFIVGVSAALIAAFFQFNSYLALLKVLLVFGLGQAAESMMLTPLLVGDRIGLHPIAVIFSILAGGQLFGFVGVLLALPFAAVLMVLLRHFKKHYIASSLYKANPLETK